MGIANLPAGLFGAVPMCHGTGGLAAHYRFGARTGGAPVIDRRPFRHYGPWLSRTRLCAPVPMDSQFGARGSAGVCRIGTLSFVRSLKTNEEYSWPC